MKYRDLIDRTQVLEALRKAQEENRQSLGGQTLCRGLDMAAEIVGAQPANNGWIDPQEGIPRAGVMLLLELTEGEKQTVIRGWWDECRREFRTVSRILSDHVVTGWQMLPEPRREKTCSENLSKR